MPDFTRVLAGPCKWAVTATATAATSTATKAAIAKQKHYIAGISISASGVVAAAVAALVQDGATTLVTIEIPATAINPITIVFAKPLECSTNSLAQVTVPSLGAGIVCATNIWGFSDSAN